MKIFTEDFVLVGLLLIASPLACFMAYLVLPGVVLLMAGVVLYTLYLLSWKLELHVSRLLHSRG